MPKRYDIKKIMLIGSGPIVIGQACEFDYSGTQACKALREEGYEVVLVNSNPATIMTDPEFADSTYIEPLTVPILSLIIEKERPDALLPTLGGQTALNLAIELDEAGVLKKFNVKMLGATVDVIKKAEDRNLFKKAMQEIGLDLPKSGLAYNMEQARKIRDEIKYPLVIRPSFTLGGTGGGFASNDEEFEDICSKGLEYSMIKEILIEESIVGWKEFELEVMRDKNDNVVIVCGIENLDPMGIHTGDSITVAPIQTLTDKEYQIMRDAALKIIRKIGVETGGSNIQFAVDPKNGRMVVIEMNPRVSRSSALASKATGFAIAKIAAKLAVGYTLDEISNDITKETPACYEPTIDYCVVKIPRWTFEKFPEANPVLTTQMKSVGETMALGRTFKEALQKALRSLEIGRYGLGADGKDSEFVNALLPKELVDEVPKINKKEILGKIEDKLKIPTADRIFYLRYALLAGMSVEKIHELSFIDKWFLENIKEIIECELKLRALRNSKISDISKDVLFEAKSMGFSDIQLASIFATQEETIRSLRQKLGVKPVYKLVDTCSAEFEAYTPYYYSTYEQENEARLTNKKKIMILGGGPNRIGQGIEFDYCCVHAAFALKKLGYETIMVNSNPETVSTDYDTSDKLYFEPLTREDVLEIIDNEKPDGVIVQFGGQTPLNIALALEKAGVPIIGTSASAIDMAEDRGKFKDIIDELNLKQPASGLAINITQAKEIANKIGYPILVRPSYVLGGRAMKIVYDEKSLEEYMASVIKISNGHPILVDKFLESAVEIDVDVICDGKTAVVGGIMEHIEEAGVHSGDSACSLPTFSITDEIVDKIRISSKQLALRLGVVGLMNVQYAIKNMEVYVLEVNPRASRTIPFVSKAIGVPLAKLAACVMVGKTLDELGFTEEKIPEYMSVKEVVLPFARFAGVDVILGPEMKSTGEVMGIDRDFGRAFAKAQIAANNSFPSSGTIFVSVKNQDKRQIVFICKRLQDLGFSLIATEGTAKALSKNGVKVRQIKKISQGSSEILDMIAKKQIGLIINTPSGKDPRADDVKIRSIACRFGVPTITTLSGAMASVTGIEAIVKESLDVKSLQGYHKV